MQIEIKIDEKCEELKILIVTNKMTEQVEELLKKLSAAQTEAIVGFKEDSAEILQQEEIIRIFSSNQKVYAQTKQGEYVLKLRLYELEERLNQNVFVRISNSEIINLKKLVKMDLSFSGTIGVKLLGNVTTYVSRRYVAKIKEVLGI
ncbi:MAG: LytTR family DNA-binding domain-containing protein [Clostridiaceae bacterium]